MAIRGLVADGGIRTRNGKGSRKRLPCRRFFSFARNLEAALWLYFAHYNFVRVHGSLRVTPAMAADVTNHLWTMEELLNSGGLR